MCWNQARCFSTVPALLGGTHSSKGPLELGPKRGPQTLQMQPTGANQTAESSRGLARQRSPTPLAQPTQHTQAHSLPVGAHPAHSGSWAQHTLSLPRCDCARAHTHSHSHTHTHTTLPVHGHNMLNMPAQCGKHTVIFTHGQPHTQTLQARAHAHTQLHNLLVRYTQTSAQGTHAHSQPVRKTGAHAPLTSLGWPVPTHGMQVDTHKCTHAIRQTRTLTTYPLSVHTASQPLLPAYTRRTHFQPARNTRGLTTSPSA